jgi:hypothetical protein
MIGRGALNVTYSINIADETHWAGSCPRSSSNDRFGPILANFAANNVAAMPILYRLA